MFDVNLYRTSVFLPAVDVMTAGVDAGLGALSGLPSGGVAAVKNSKGVIQFSVIDAGPRDAQTTLVFVHGFGGYSAYWSHQLAHFQDNYRVVAPDLRGHGLSDAPVAGYSVAQLAADLEGILAAVGVPETFVLVSHSFGGAVCSEFIRRHPDRVLKWVVIGMPVRFRLSRVGKFILGLPKPVLSFARRLFPRGRLYPRTHVVSEQNRLALSVWDGEVALPLIHTPVLIIRGAYDFLFSSEHFTRVAHLLPQAREFVIPVSAHQVMNERPEAVNRAMDLFLGGVDWKTVHAQRRARRASLERLRPWLKWYDSRTPPEIRVPRGPVGRYLDIAAKRFPKEAALVFLRRRISYAQLQRMANRFAFGLLRQGLAPGDRVLIALPSIPQAAIAYYGTLKARGVVVFADVSALDSEGILARAELVGAKVVVTLSTHYQNLIHLPEGCGVERVIFTTYREFMGWLDWLPYTLAKMLKPSQYMPWWRVFTDVEFRKHVRWFYQLMRPSAHSSGFGGEEADLVEPHVDDLAVLQVSEWGAGHGRQVAALSHRNVVFNALQMRHWMPEARPGQERIVSVTPYAYAHGLVCSLNLAPLLGAALVMQDRDGALGVAKAIKRFRPTIVCADPYLYQKMAYLQGIRQFDIASVRVCFAVGAPLSMEVQEAFEKLTHGRVIELYSLTQAGAVLATPLSANRRYASMGVPLPDTAAKIMREDGLEACPNGVVGVLWIKGPQCSHGVWCSNSQSVILLESQEGWVKTRDVAWQDADGFFYFVDQAEHCIRVGEQSVYTREIEEVFLEHPAVADVVVLPYQDSLEQQFQDGRLRACVVLHHAYHDVAEVESDLMSWVEQRVVDFVRVKKIHLCVRLPRTRSGAVDRAKLRDTLGLHTFDV